LNKNAKGWKIKKIRKISGPAQKGGKEKVERRDKC
jgi:hypothetical protein